MDAITKRQSQASAEVSSLRTVAAVAEYLSLSRSKIYELMNCGELPFAKIGKSRRVRWEDVLKLVEKSMVDRG